jgi:D-alanine-D-alanine ligase
MKASGNNPLRKMNTHSDIHHLPIYLLYNIDRDWPVYDIDEARQAARFMCDALDAEGYKVSEVCIDDPDLISRLNEYKAETSLIINCCEELPGIPHSSAQVAKTLETLGFVFTGAGSETLALSEDKPSVKQRLLASEVTVPPWRVYDSTSPDGWKHFPAIVKPAYEHCSYGVTNEAVVLNSFELLKRIDYIWEKFNQPVLVEEFIDGREFHVTIVGNGDLQVLPVAEMDFSTITEIRKRLCTYESKFDPSSEQYQSIKLRLPASLSEQEELELRITAIQAYKAIECRDYARLDIRLRNGIFYVLDVNPNADLSPDTSSALAAELSGLSYGQLASALVKLASHRQQVQYQDHDK